MEMATQTKATTAAAAAIRAQAAVKAATGNGNSYTQNISTVKEPEVKKINCCCKGSTAKLAETQNNKTEIKISHYKWKRNHLKCLINFYFKFILCINHINNHIIKRFKTKTNTKYNYYNSPNCIINLQQQEKLQAKAVFFKAISFNLKIIINFLIKFHYCNHRILIKYVKLPITHNNIKHFVGICLKRLISLKRLQQQIPENHAKIDESSLLKQTKIRTCHYGYLKEELQFGKANSLSSVNCQKERKFKENSQVPFNLQGKAYIKVLNCHNIKTHKSSDLEQPYRIGSKNCCQINQQKDAPNRNIRSSIKVNQQETRNIKQIKAVYRSYSRDFKCVQIVCNIVYIIGNEEQERTVKSRHLLTKTAFKLHKLSSPSFKACGRKVLLEHTYCKDDIIAIHLKSVLQVMQAYWNEEYDDLTEKLKHFLRQRLTYFCHQLYQKNNRRVAVEYSICKQGYLEIVLRTKYQDSLKYRKENYGHLAKYQDVKIQDLLINSTQRCNQLKQYIFRKIYQFLDQLRLVLKLRKTYGQLTKLRDFEIQKFSTNSPEQCGQLNKKHTVQIADYIYSEYQIKYDLQNALEILKKGYSQFTNTLNNEPKNMAYTKNNGHLNINRVASWSSQKNFDIFKLVRKQCGQLNASNKNQQSRLHVAIATAYENNTKNKLPKFHQIFCYKNTLLRQTSLSFFSTEEAMKLADNTNIVRQFQLDDNNNSSEVESKQQIFLKKCQHIPYSIIIYCCCCCCFCYWHIYGFPLVLGRIFKYLKDATVHVLTRRLKITTTIKIARTIATSIYHNVKAACDGKLKKPTKVPYYKANQQNVLKRQTHTTTSFPCAYSSLCCLTTSLTASSSYCKSLEKLIVLQKKIQQPWMSYCHYQQHQRRQHHHHHQHHRDYYQHHHPHYYQHNRHEQQVQQRQQQPKHQHQHQQYDSSSNNIHFLHLPSLLAVSRTLIILILLSSLWHTSEGFHGSGVKFSTNTVKTKYGLVRGIIVRSSPSLVEAYLGIPYASPPVGSLRFMPPITPSTWKNIRNADRFSPVCPQNVPIPPNGPEALLEVPRARLAQLRRLLPLLSNQSEDCLYLNIYVPYENRRHRRFTSTSGELNYTPKLPTILFIHGESYEWNSGNPYDGSELASHGNVIVVTINFRLGILGFLKTGGKESAQGNFGLMDLVAGLHWLKENLPAFGGDPQQITLLGHGTGAALANILVVSPVASDLVQHTVMVSGSALSPWAIQKNPLFVKRRVAEQTGCHGDMLYYDLAPCLRTKPLTELLAVKIDHPRFLVGFAPFVDGTVISPNTDSIGKLSLPLGSAIVSTSGIEYANFPKRNLIFCLTSVESHLDLNAQDLEFGFNETRRDRILRTYVRNNFHYHLNEIFAVLKNEYTDWDKAIRSPLSSRDATLQFLSDGHTASSLIKLGYMHSLRGGKGYFLHFKHRTVEEEYPQRTGSVRGEDVPFWMGLPISPLFPHNYTTQEKQISHLMLRYLANFAKTGNPNQSSLSSPLPSSSSLIGSPSSFSTSSSLSSQAADDSHEKIKRSSFKIVNATSSTSSGPIKSSNIVEDVATAAAREALNLAVLYNQRRTKRTYYKRHSRSNDDHSGSGSSEVNYFLGTNNNNNNKLESDELPFWDAYDIVNQLYMELGNKAEIQSHYRGHKLSMWLNLIPQLHRHANMNDQSMRHHQFQDDLNNLNLYEGIVRAQIQTKPDDDDENVLAPKGRPTPPPPAQETNTTQKAQGGTTECGVDGAMFVAEMTALPPTENQSLVLDSREKEMATASTGIIGNLEVLRRLSGKQFQSYTTALVATVAVGFFLLILNVLIFAGIYHQREKRARDAKTKEELQDNDTSKNSSMLKLNVMGSETGSFNGSGAGVSGKTTVVFGEYSCYDEKSLQTKDEKLIVELPPAQMLDANWAACSTSTLDLLKTKHHNPLDTTYTVRNVVPINTEPQTEHLLAINNLEMATYNPLPMASGLIIDPAFVPTSSTGLLSKRGSFVGSSGQLNQYDFASVQSSDQMSFKDIENAVKASATINDDITQDDDIPEPPPPPRSFQSLHQQQQQQTQAAANGSASTSVSGGGGILRQTGTASTAPTGGSKKRVHIQEISV